MNNRGYYGGNHPPMRGGYHGGPPRQRYEYGNSYGGGAGGPYQQPNRGKKLLTRLGLV